jgi:2-dehydro-3-deoxyphosphogluconate aldolase / (4S)-4-hydroxy-2-oxoglutarate aldolase
MARYIRSEVLSAMKNVGVIPVFYNANINTAKNVIAACADGGANVIEFTNRGDQALEVFKTLFKYCAEQRQDVILGVGSILDAPTAANYIGAGADFIVGPTLNEEVARLCNIRKIPYSPGCGSATEISKAHALGVDICKVFPGSSVGGPAFVKAVRGPMPWTEIMPTGGVSPNKENLQEWFEAGIVCAGMGSKLITKELIASGDYKGITNHVKKVIAIIRELRE